MNVEIIAESFQLDIYGFGDIAPNKDYTQTAFKLSGKMWEVVKAGNLTNKGKNIWVYETGNKVFAGVELDHPSGNNHGLEKKQLHLEKYAYYKHIGSYNLIKQTGQNMSNELNKQGFEIILPYVSSPKVRPFKS